MTVTQLIVRLQAFDPTFQALVDAHNITDVVQAKGPVVNIITTPPPPAP